MKVKTRSVHLVGFVWKKIPSLKSEYSGEKNIADIGHQNMCSRNDVTYL